jgi:hypothetical protein
MRLRIILSLILLKLALAFRYPPRYRAHARNLVRSSFTYNIHRIQCQTPRSTNEDVTNEDDVVNDDDDDEEEDNLIENIHTDKDIEIIGGAGSEESIETAVKVNIFLEHYTEYINNSHILCFIVTYRTACFQTKCNNTSREIQTIIHGEFRIKK